jgi:hypothetical protein
MASKKGQPKEVSITIGPEFSGKQVTVDLMLNGKLVRIVVPPSKNPGR